MLTLDNTKDATHYYIGKMVGIIFRNDRQFIQGSMNFMIDSYESIPNYAVELSRPHNETREYWTHFGVTEYAQQQKEDVNFSGNDHHIALQVEALGDVVGPVVTIEAHEEDFNVHFVATPTFTQAMADESYMPPIGCECLLILDLACDRDDNTDKTTECKIVAHESDLIVCVYTKFPGQGFYNAFIGSKDLFKPIQTAEEKLFDALYLATNDDDISDDLNRELVIELMTHKDFTITLKG